MFIFIRIYLIVLFMAAFLLVYVVNIEDVPVTAYFAFYPSMPQEKEQYQTTETTEDSFIAAVRVAISTAADNDSNNNYDH